eukprot:CAMPEP_0185017656 /NCGR_PEP_ID=MMETSP1103-20130426/575_1 /TAXON_ID=36769 /ORGANISM="Paraphysomonas bandaiensis, Strain Caron Lab Isolate" /LENGTH=468 /DNA_ID=CAMNT_0027547167 /DNA_START=206 /DNA_END=1612 /DNA_ORIENTATION=-
MSSWKLFRGRSRRRSFVKKYSILEEEDSQASVDIPESEDNSNIGTWNAIGLQRPLVIAMVGLPARGKSYIVKMIIRYLRWIGFESEVFNVGSYRRLHGKAGIGANFFSGDDKEASKSREEMAMAVQEMMYEWLRKGDVKGRVAIFDATNTTVDRRHALCLRARREQVSLLFVESICDDKSILERNYSLKLQNDDYKDQDPSEARKDFLRRVDAYEKRYHTIEDDEDSHQISYIKLINVGQKVISRNCFGYLPSQVAFYLQNIHIVPRSIYLTLPAENSDSVASILGGDSPKMTASGRQYTLDLAKFVQMQNNKEDMLVLTGTAKIHALTSLHLRMQVPVYTTNLLNELRGGDFHLMKREEIKVKHRAVYEARQKNKLHYRYPGVGGESYMDVIERVRPIIIELERQRQPVLVVCHLAVMRCIYGYFTGACMEEIPSLPFKMHHVYQLSPGPFGCETRRLELATEVMDM